MRASPRDLLLLLTNKCNLACGHCYMSSGRGGEHGLSRDVSLRVIREFGEMTAEGRVAISGGEALFRRDDAFAVLRSAADSHATKLVSNGTLITDRVADTLVDLGIDVKISLDGPTPAVHDQVRGPGTFARAMRGLRRLREAGIESDRLQVGSVVTRRSVDYIRQMTDAMDGCQVNMLRLDAPNPTGRGATFCEDSEIADWMRQALPAFIGEHLNDWSLYDIDRTARPFDTVNVYPDGTVYLYTPHDPREDWEVLGNVTSATLPEILTPERVRRVATVKTVRVAHSRGGSRTASFYLVRDGVDASSVERVLGRDALQGRVL